jgi:ADP-ribose pyrophosphatase YjhB (NUDIX family)
VLAALAVVIRDGAVLLVRRAKPPDAGLWGFPGGHLELGETLFACAVRELFEETGVRAAARAQLTNVEVIRTGSDGRVVRHFVLAAVICEHLAGEPVAGDDALEADWVPLEEVAAEARPMSADVARLAALAYGPRHPQAGP